MVQVFNLTPTESSGSLLGKAIAQGIARRFPTPEQQVQKGLLEGAFQKLRQAPQGDYLAQLEAIAPQLLTTAGGAEALSSIAPLLSQRAQNEAILESIKKRRQPEPVVPTGEAQAPGTAPRMEPTGQPLAKAPPKQGIDKYTGLPEETYEPESQFPYTTAEPQKMQKIMSPQELRDFATDMVEQSMLTAKPISFQDAFNMGLNLNKAAQDFNAQVESERQLRNENIKAMSSGMIERAKNSNLIDKNSPEDETIIGKLAYKFRNEKTPEDQWEKVRTAFRDFNTARNKILREETVPTFYEKWGRKLNGTYKDLEQLQKNLQPVTKKYLELGLVDELRDMYINTLGMGAEDAEMTIFPFKGDQAKQIEAFPMNKTQRPAGKYAAKHTKFPSSEFSQSSENYEDFKNELATYLQNNPGVNLIALRGRLNQDKRYSWQDISNAMSELIMEKRFTPNYIQNSQLNVVDKAPLPGLTQQFNNWLKGTK